MAWLLLAGSPLLKPSLFIRLSTNPICFFSSHMNTFLGSTKIFTHSLNNPFFPCGCDHICHILWSPVTDAKASVLRGSSCDSNLCAACLGESLGSLNRAQHTALLSALHPCVATPAFPVIFLSLSPPHSQ